MTPEEEDVYRALRADALRTPARKDYPARTAIITLAIALLSFLAITWLV